MAYEDVPKLTQYCDLHHQPNRTTQVRRARVGAGCVDRESFLALIFLSADGVALRRNSRDAMPACPEPLFLFCAKTHEVVIFVTACC